MLNKHFQLLIFQVAERFLFPLYIDIVSTKFLFKLLGHNIVEF